LEPDQVQQISIFWEEDAVVKERKASTSSTGSGHVEEDEEIAEIRRRISTADIIETRRDKERRVSNADVFKVRHVSKEMLIILGFGEEEETE
jgi:hypothetical protein